MKKILITSLFLILEIQNSFSQWIQQPVPSGVGILLSIDFINDNTGISGGWIFGAIPIGRAIYTTNAGANWNLANVPDSSRSFVSVKFINTQTGYMGGAYNLNTDSHSNVLTPDHIKNNSNLVNRKYGDIIGLNEAIDYSAMYLKTSNGGRNWSSYGTLPPQYTYLIGMDFINETTGFVTAHIQDTAFLIRSNILKTTNGGLSWTEQLSSYINGELLTVRALDLNTAIAVGYDRDSQSGIILKSVNGGANWTTQIINDVDLNDVFFTNSSTGFVTGHSQLLVQQFVYKTTNQGLNWNIVKTLNSTAIFGIRFYPTSGIGMIYGNYLPPPPHVLAVAFTSRTTNFGETWSKMQDLDTGNHTLAGGILLSPYNIYITGGNVFEKAVIYHTTNGGGVFVNPIGNLIPEKFYLSQNYPNPFNPTTYIKFSIPKPGFVNLTVYNILGKKVATLANEKLPAGNYRVDFDATEFASGVYFYKITSGDFTDVKKMTVLK